MEYSKFIDQTLLRSDATPDEIYLLCFEAKMHHFMSVCVNPCYVNVAKNFLSGSDVKVTTVIGFPLGANTIKNKVDETIDAINNGADEIDMVMNIGMFKGGHYEYIKEEIAAIRKASTGHILKVIIETCLLTKDEIVKASEIVLESGADFVKTSTGFSKSGAQVEDVKLIKEVVKNQIGIKASGGIKCHSQFLQMLDAGATRIGTSSGKELLKNHD